VRKIIVSDPNICTGCRTCEAVCSTFHERRCNPVESRLCAITYSELGIFVPVVCHHCEDPECMEACPVDAILKDERTEGVVINQDECTGCELCIEACPIGAIKKNPKTGQIVKCDLCGGDPTCVKFCSVDALKYMDMDEMDIRQNRDRIELFQSKII